MKIKCIDTGGYSNITIGKEYEVSKEDTDFYYIQSDDNIKDNCFYKYRFEIVEELPEKWCIKRDLQNADIINKYFKEKNSKFSFSDKNNYLTSDHLICSNWLVSIDRKSNGYTEIDFKTFEKLVLNKTAMEKKIIGYKVPMDLYGGEIKKGDVAVMAISKKNYCFNSSSSKPNLPIELVETWEPAYEEEKITIGSYTMEIVYEKAVFGCQEFTKQELLAYKRLFHKELKGNIMVLGTGITKELLNKIISKL